MHRLDQDTCYLLRQRPMLERSSTPKRFFEFVGDVRADEDAFPIRHDSVWTPDLLNRGQVRKEQTCKPNFVPTEVSGDHSSRPPVTRRLERPTRKRRDAEAST